MLLRSDLTWAADRGEGDLQRLHQKALTARGYYWLWAVLWASSPCGEVAAGLDCCERAHLLSGRQTFFNGSTVRRPRAPDRQ
jgi:hypothetical protein